MNNNRNVSRAQVVPGLARMAVLLGLAGLVAALPPAGAALPAMLIQGGALPAPVPASTTMNTDVLEGGPVGASCPFDPQGAGLELSAQLREPAGHQKIGGPIA